MEQAGKPLAELKTELDLGLTVYPSTNPDVQVYLLEGRYVFFFFDMFNGGTPRETPLTDEGGYSCMPSTHPDDPNSFDALVHASGYKTFEDLCADWPVLTSQQIWSTSQTQESLDWVPISREEYTALRQEVDAELAYFGWIAPVFKLG